MMDRAWKNVVFLCVLVLLAGVSRASAQKSMVEHLRSEWDSERREFSGIAEAMRDHFSYRATPEVRTFGEIVVHVIDDNTGFLDGASGAKRGPENQFSNLKTPPEILKALTEHFDRGAKILADMTEQQALASVPYGNRGEVPRWLLIMQAIGHAKEHYGNLVTYTRLNGIVPPTTAAAQQRQQQQQQRP